MRYPSKSDKDGRVEFAAEIQKELASLEDHQIALFSQRFFKTGPGEYGEGDRFRGIRVPVLRRLARKYQGH